MLNFGEQFVSSYLQYVRKCDFTRTNVHTGSQGEIDVIAVNLEDQKVYVCEVAIHIRGLQYAKENRINNIKKLIDKFSIDIEYANKNFHKYKHHFMFWSPIVLPAAEQHLEEVKKNIQKKYNIDIEYIINKKFHECLEDLRRYATKEDPTAEEPIKNLKELSTKKFECPIMRLMQIEEHLIKRFPLDKP